MHLIGRRNLLNGLGLGAGATLLGGIWKKIVPEALGQAPRKRIIIFVGSNGLIERFSTCQSRGERDFDLGPAYQPVAAYKDRLTIMHRFFIGFGASLHGSQQSTLTVMPSTQPGAAQYRGPAGGVSIDRFIAKKIGTADAFSSTAVGRGISVSADAANQQFPLILSPAKAFSTYFGGALPPSGGMAGPAGGSFEGDFQKDKSFLDVVQTDITKMNARLAAPERAKLDQYLESLRALERQIGQRGVAQAGCMKPAAPSGPEPALNQQIEQLVDITAAVHRCGLTHVTYVSFEGMEGPKVKYTWLGDTRNHHDDHHAGDTNMTQKIATWWFTQMARMADHLAKTPEGNGTMLDNSILAMLNTGGGVHHRGGNKHPVILLGGRPGTGGRYLQYPEGRHGIGDVYVSLANMMGATTQTFGDPKICKGPLPGLA
jgi:hypothetical protein